MKRGICIAVTCGAALLLSIQAFGQNAAPLDPELRVDKAPTSFDCAFETHDVILQNLKDAIARGEIADPLLTDLPDVAPRIPDSGIGLRVPPTVTADDIFPFEDTAGLLLTNFSDNELLVFMGGATTAMINAHGDNYDFSGFFVNFVPDHQIGSAFYMPMVNDVSGIGDSIFDQRADFGIVGNQIQGMVQMWRIGAWGPDDTTMLVLGQEFEHRWAMFLADLLDGRSMQGFSGCGRGAHWNWQVDGQGSGMEIREWIGSSPASLGGDCAPGGFFFICRNSDIGGVFSYTDLYLMGYVSPSEMDNGNSELRFMEGSDCSSDFNGTISTFDSSDIIASNGARTPDSTTAQQNYHTGWIVIHQPGSPPTLSERQAVADILNAWTAEWSFATLGRGEMDNSLVGLFTIDFPNGAPTELTPNTPTNFDVQTTSFSATPDPNSGLLHYSVDGGAEQTAALAFVSGNDYVATIPGIACLSTVEYFVTIDAIGGGTVSRPAGGATISAQAVSGTNSIVSLNFETSGSFTVSGGASDGVWDRGIPVGCGRGDPSADFDGSGQCWLTDNSAANGCNSDVDDGSTTLTSAAYDLSSVSSARLTYARWFTNNAGSNPGEDSWVVEISDDGSTWVELENTTASSGWVEMTYDIGSFVSLSSSVQVRFTTSDDPGSGSVVEAGVDAFRIDEIVCSAVGCPGDLDLDGSVGLSDLAILLSNFGTASGAQPEDGDLNGDGAVDLSDLATLLSVFGTACP